MLGGDLTVVSALGQGTTFIIKLTLKLADKILKVSLDLN
jgi:signal transduction histidine kinase